MSDEENRTGNEFSDPLFQELGRANPDREAALAAYRQRDAGWDQLAEPVRFLRHHPLVDDDGKPGPNFLQTWAGLAVVLILLGGFGYSLFAFDLKFSGYFARLFAEPGKMKSVSLAERPEEISVSDFPREYRDRIESINAHIAAEQWTDAVEKATALKDDKTAIAVIKTDGRALAKLYEALAAAKMALRTNGLANAREVLILTDDYRKMGGVPTLKLAYQELLARFELAGGERVNYRRGDLAENAEIIEGTDALADEYGTRLSEDQAKQLRQMRVYSLIRLLDSEKDLKAINSNPQAVERWRRLHTDLTIWRGNFPKAENKSRKPWDRSAWVEAWREKPRDFLKCDRWFWERLASLEPFKGSKFTIGDMQFDGNDAAFNAKVIREALQ